MTDLRIKPQSRSDLVVDRITNSIINGELTDGQLLPPESQLCEALGVSRSILREAVRVLSSKGLVEVRQGHGNLCPPASNRRAGRGGAQFFDDQQLSPFQAHGSEDAHRD